MSAVIILTSDSKRLLSGVAVNGVSHSEQNGGEWSQRRRNMTATIITTSLILLILIEFWIEVNRK